MGAIRGILWNQPRRHYRSPLMVLELLKEHILNSRLYFRLLCDHLMSMRLMGIHVMTITSFTSLPCAQDTGGENPYIDTKDVRKLLIVGDSAVRLLVTLGARSAW